MASAAVEVTAGEEVTATSASAVGAALRLVGSSEALNGEALLAGLGDGGVSDTIDAVVASDNDLT